MSTNPVANFRNQGPHSRNFSGKSLEKIQQSNNLELANNNTIIIVINTYFCVMLDVIRPAWRRC